MANFYHPRTGDTTTIRLLTTKGKLNGGKEISYAMGINADKFRGRTRYLHNGALAGYRTIIAVYPELKMGFILFGNSGDGQLYGKVDQLAAILIADHQKNNEVAPSKPMSKDSAAAELKANEIFTQLKGDYIAENGYHLNFSIRQNKLWLNQKNLLIQVSDSTFALFSNPAVKYVFPVRQNETSTDLYSPVFDKPIHLLKSVNNTMLSDEQLKKYAGIYGCPELGCYCQIGLKDHELYLDGGTIRTARITLMGTDHLFSDSRRINYIYRE